MCEFYVHELIFHPITIGNFEAKTGLVHDRDVQVTDLSSRF